MTTEHYFGAYHHAGERCIRWALDGPREFCPSYGDAADFSRVLTTEERRAAVYVATEQQAGGGILGTQCPMYHVLRLADGELVAWWTQQTKWDA